MYCVLTILVVINNNTAIQQFTWSALVNSLSFFEVSFGLQKFVFKIQLPAGCGGKGWQDSLKIVATPPTPDKVSFRRLKMGVCQSENLISHPNCTKK